MEGRSHKRSPIQIGCWIVQDDGESCCCSTFDISDAGIAIATDTPLPAGQTVCLQLYTPHSASPLSLVAEVIWSRSDHDGAMGLKFLDLTEEESSRLKEMTRQMAHRELNTRKLYGPR